ARILCISLHPVKGTSLWSSTITSSTYCEDISSYYASHTAIYTLSLHDALPIWGQVTCSTDTALRRKRRLTGDCTSYNQCLHRVRSEEHTSELQSRFELVCRLLLEKKR